MKLNRVLLNQVGEFREFKSEKCIGMFRDGTALPFQLEKLIELGAIGVALPDYELYRQFIKKLPHAFRKRVSLVSTKKSEQNSSAILSPIIEEFGIDASFGELLFNRKVPRELRDSLSFIIFSLPEYLLGIENGLQVDLSIPQMLRGLGMIQKHSKNPASRANVAILKAVFATYKQHSLNAMVLKSDATADFQEAFEEFVDDQVYRKLSSHFFQLGIPSMLDLSIIKIKELTKKLVKKPIAKWSMDIAVRKISAATEIPLPDSELIQQLLASNYLPPVISLRSSLAEARTNWLRQSPSPDPELMPPSMMQNMYSDDETGKIRRILKKNHR